MNGPILDLGWTAAHLGDIWALLVEHVELTVIAVVAGFVISFALAILANRWRRLAAPMIGATGILYTIPSIALFAALVRITGLTIVSVEIPLIVAGIRLATVSTIGLVTITGILGDRFGGLGFFIFEGYRHGFPTEIVAGAVPSIVLAVALDLLLVAVQRRLTPWESVAERGTGTA